jgi:hypothetical protein
VIELDHAPKPVVSLGERRTAHLISIGKAKRTPTTPSVADETKRLSAQNRQRSDSPVEVESPDPLQQDGNVMPKLKRASYQAGASTHQKAVAERRASSAMEVNTVSRKTLASSPGDIKHTKFLRSGREKAAPTIASRRRSVPERSQELAWPVDRIRSGPYEAETEGLMLKWDPELASFLPYFDGNDLSRSMPELKAHRNDIYTILYNDEAKKLQFKLRMANDKSRAETDCVDVEFTSEVSVTEVVDLLERLGLASEVRRKPGYVVIMSCLKSRRSSDSKSKPANRVF